MPKSDGEADDDAAQEKEGGADNAGRSADQSEYIK
jgi:hypothetical protein